MAWSAYAVAEEEKKPTNQPKKPQQQQKKSNIKTNSLHCAETFRGIQEPVKNLYKLGGRKTSAARVLQKGQGLTLLDRSAE